MPRSQAPRSPKICRHQTGQAYVTLGGQRHYLGRHTDPIAHEQGHRLIAEWLANGKRLRVEPNIITVLEVIVAYLGHADTYYRRPDGEPSERTLGNIKLALKVPKQLYGSARAIDFGPLALRACRDKWIAEGLRRTTINMRVAALKQAFKWAVSCEMVPPAVFQGLAAVDGLRKGRSAAKESRVVSAVAESHVFALEGHVSRQVFGLIRLQLYSGARSGEILKLRRCDIDTTGEVWKCHLAHHKTAHKSKARTLYFGERAQAVLRDFFINKGPFDYLFSPKDAEKERYAACELHRRPNQKPDPIATERTLGDCYTSDSYRKAVARGCISANVPMWHPHQLRHACATKLEREFGLAAAAVFLGHAHIDTTKLYAQLDATQAVTLARKVG